MFFGDQIGSSNLEAAPGNGVEGCFTWFRSGCLRFRVSLRVSMRRKPPAVTASPRHICYKRKIRVPLTSLTFHWQRIASFSLLVCTKLKRRALSHHAHILVGAGAPDALFRFNAIPPVLHFIHRDHVILDQVANNFVVRAWSLPLK